MSAICGACYNAEVNGSPRSGWRKGKFDSSGKSPAYRYRRKNTWSRITPLLQRMLTKVPQTAAAPAPNRTMYGLSQNAPP